VVATRWCSESARSRSPFRARRPSRPVSRTN
jgi:hypothetical protein